MPERSIQVDLNWVFRLDVLTIFYTISDWSLLPRARYKGGRIGIYIIDELFVLSEFDFCSSILFELNFGIAVDN